MGKFPLGPAAVFCVILSALGWSQLAQARTATTTTYTKAQTFNAAHRFLRVEKNYEITEKDPDSGYLLFKYPRPHRERETSGSVQVIEREDSVVLVIQLPKMPEHHERYLVDGLLEKLSADYGEPPARTPEDEDDDSADESESTDEAGDERPPANDDSATSR